MRNYQLQKQMAVASHARDGCPVNNNTRTVKVPFLVSLEIPRKSSRSISGKLLSCSVSKIISFCLSSAGLIRCDFR